MKNSIRNFEEMGYNLAEYACELMNEEQKQAFQKSENIKNLYDFLIMNQQDIIEELRNFDVFTIEDIEAVEKSEDLKDELIDEIAENVPTVLTM